MQWLWKTIRRRNLLGYEIKYNSVEEEQTPDPFDSDLKVLPRYNGNIAEVDWRTSTVSGDHLRRYGYVYDKLNRLSAGFYQKDSNPSAREYYEKVSYDSNGNIMTLKRSAEAQGTFAFNIDELTYVYENSNKSNRLLSVTDSSTDYRGYPDTSGSIIPYDDNGNMTSQKDKGILQIDYNFLNLPYYIKFDRSLSNRSGRIYENTNYLYRADGRKLRKIFNYAPPNPLGTVTQLSSIVTEYLDGFQYESTATGKKGSMALALKFVPTAEGYYNFENNKYIYNYADHLGNVRLSYFNNGSSIEVLEESNYYPFGLKHEGYNVLAGNPFYKYGYNGKELQTESGMQDYGARFYMPDIGRWGVVDPLAEKMRRFSPYNYAFNNPIRFVDPDGRQNEDWIRKDGKWQYDANVITVEQAQKMEGVDGFAKNGTVLANVSLNGGAESAYAQLNEGGSVTKLASDDLASMNAIVDMLPMSLGGSWTTWTQETFQIFTGGANETDSETMKKVLPGDKLETNNMFEYILNGFNRSRSPDLDQFAIDMQGIGNPFNLKNNDSAALVEQISDSPFSYLRDTIKKVSTQTKTSDSIMFNKAVKNVNDQKLKNFYNRINFLDKKW